MSENEKLMELLQQAENILDTTNIVNIDDDEALEALNNYLTASKELKNHIV